MFSWKSNKTQSLCWPPVTLNNNQSASKHGRRTFLYSAMGELVCSGQLWVRAALRQLRSYASVNSKHQHPPRADPWGNFLKWSKTLPRGKIFLQKHGPRDKKIPTPGEYCERSSQLFLLVGVSRGKFVSGAKVLAAVPSMSQPKEFTRTDLKLAVLGRSFQQTLKYRDLSRNGESHLFLVQLIIQFICCHCLVLIHVIVVQERDRGG